jgi:DNA polymerase-1
MGAIGIMSAYFPFRHESNNLPKEWQKDLFAVLEHANLVFHNLKFDLHSLHTFGFTPLGKLYDTLTIAHMVNEELFSYSLDSLCRKYLDDGKSKDEVGPWTKAFGWASVPSGLMEEYASKDAELTLRLFEYLWPELGKQQLNVLWPRERDFARLLTNIERRGVGVVLEHASRKEAIGNERMQDIVDELGFSPSSPIELGEYLIDHLGLEIKRRGKPTKKYPEGRPSFAKDVIEKYIEDLELMILSGQIPDDYANVGKLILEFRGWQKAVTSLYKPLQEMVSPDGRVRCNFKQHGTVTSRLSCSEPNLQQIPRATEKPWNGDSKLSFRASEGYELWGYDYSQLEFRLAAAYGKEHWLLEEFANPNGDVFTRIAKEIGVERQTVKTYVYATLYGAGLSKVAKTLGRTDAEIQPTYQAFKDSIAGIGNVSRSATKRAESRGYVTLWTGRRRHFTYREECYKAFNSLLQGGGAEVVKSAMLAIDADPRIDKDECRIVLQVHDEIVFEVKPECREKYEPIIIEHMTNFNFGVRLAVEGKEWTGASKVLSA